MLKRERLRKGLNLMITFQYKINIHSLRIKNILKELKMKSKETSVFIKSYFNGVWFPIHVLADKQNLEKFKNVLDKPYVIFKTNDSDRWSETAYWLIVDNGYKNKKDILENTEWIVHNSLDFVKDSQNEKQLKIRALYKDLKFKPKLIFKSDDLSNNFKKFIHEIIKFYNNEGLEFSVIKSLDKEMYAIFKRKAKFKRING